MAFYDALKNARVELKRKQEEERKSKEGGSDFLGNLGKAILAAGLTYLSGGLAEGLMGGFGGGAAFAPAAAGVAGAAPAATSGLGLGATALNAATALPGASLGSIITNPSVFAPTAARLLPALGAGAEALAADTTPEKAIGYGISKGLEQPLETLKSNVYKGVAEKAGLAPYSMTKGEFTYKAPELTPEEKTAQKIAAALETLKGKKEIEKKYTPTGASPPGYARDPATGKLYRLPTPGKGTSAISSKAATVYQAAQALLNKGEDVNAVVENVNATTSISSGDKAKIILKLRGAKPKSSQEP